MHKAGVSAVIGTIFLVSIAVVIGFGLWSVASGFSTAFMTRQAADTGEMIAQIRSAIVVEYAAVIDGEFKVCVYNNGEVDLKLVDIVFLNKTGSLLTPLNPQDIADLESRGRNRVCVSRSMPDGESTVIARIYALPAYLFNPDDPFDRFDRTVYTDYLIESTSTTTTTTNAMQGGGESIGLLYFFKEAAGTPMRWLKQDQPPAGSGQSVKIEDEDEEWWATVDTYDLGPASSGGWTLHLEYEEEDDKPSIVHVKIYVSDDRETPGDLVGEEQFEVPEGDGSIDVEIDVTISDECTGCYVQVEMHLDRPNSSYADELRIRMGRNNRYTTLSG